MVDIVSYFNEELDLGRIDENQSPHQDHGPVLATPAFAAALVGGVTLVGGAYALGQLVG
ncbi:hypothetical protein CU044_3390 [Streptomyces sp. L-9-10]|uniref:hypothetical protein n=1 Tax=Streptomyces sp. L-9-10 TaxID=1478131 RepID=UPI0010F168C7|nr:hypothetical protein [Streptomyces sp. L-9-10]RYJ26896.1 hypothetical protein CU044_3390 [Streptomyces sp. L-9-10]